MSVTKPLATGRSNDVLIQIHHSSPEALAAFQRGDWRTPGDPRRPRGVPAGRRAGEQPQPGLPPPPPRRPAPPRAGPGAVQGSVQPPGGSGGKCGSDPGDPGPGDRARPIRVRPGAGPSSPRGAGRGGRWSRRWFPGPALFSSPFPFSRLPSLSPGVGGTSPASSSLSNREGGKEPPALSCLPANFSGTRVSNSPPRPQPGSCSSNFLWPRGPGAPAAGRSPPGARRPPLGPSGALPRGSPGGHRSPLRRPPVGPSRPLASLLPGGQETRRPSAPRRRPDFSLCWMRTRAPRRRGPD